jgi:hypothetical protein
MWNAEVGMVWQRAERIGQSVKEDGQLPENPYQTTAVLYFLIFLSAEIS